MNLSKILLPPDWLINFYCWFSYFTLFLCSILTPLVFYVILTQSKNLKSFKWLILHHLFWCFTFEIYFASFKPLLLVPATAGFSLGFLLNGTLKLTGICAMINFLLVANCITSLFATLLCRYLLVFPSGLSKYLSLKPFPSP